jgi:hypothetical protein
MPRPKNEEGFRLIKRNFEGRKLFYARFIDEEDEPEAHAHYAARQERKAQLEKEAMGAISKAFSDGD